MYVGLHNRSAYSFGSSLTRVEELPSIAKAFGMPAVALTDVDGLYGAVAFQQACAAAGVRPIFGAELALRRGEETPKGEKSENHKVKKSKQEGGTPKRGNAEIADSPWRTPKCGNGEVPPSGLLCPARSVLVSCCWWRMIEGMETSVG